MAIKTASEINREIVAAMHNQGGYESADLLDIIYKWGLSIIDECIVKAQIMIDKRQYAGGQQVSLTWYEVDDNESIHVDRESIESVKQQL